MNLLALLTDRALITASQAAAFDAESQTTQKPLEEVLEKNGISLSDVLKAKGEYYQIPIREIGGPIPFETLRYIPEESAAHYQFAPLGVEDGVLEVGIVDPDNIEARDALNFISSRAGLPYKIYLISEKDFAQILQNYRGLSGEVGKALTELETVVEKDEPHAATEMIDEAVPQEEMAAASGPITEDAPVTKIVGTIIRYATEGGASDIHIEPLPKETRVRFRVDGVLTTSLTLPAKVHNAVAARIKVLSNMRLDEKRKPQDGRFSARVDGRKIDFRVSTFPTYNGEKVEMRILGLEVKQWTLEALGMSEHDLKLVRDAIQKPYGLILISGPTGSGKSTTLYAMLNEIDREKFNVLSLEDPVEYSIPGVSQSQVRPEIGYTFASGLRTTLRQDPDIIMVGEIRDKETAQLAVQAALTGHLVLSTIHTNNSVGIVPRLIDMGVDPYLIPPTLILGIAQRLVRRLCPGGGKKVPIQGSLKAMLDKQFEDLPKEYRGRVSGSDSVYRLEPTPECPHGTRGRVAAFEVMEMNAELERIILANKPAEDIYAVARKSGMLTMREDAIIKSMQGIVPFEEVNTLGDIFDFDADPEEVKAVEAVPTPEEA